ncbi:hypothetical protein [Streptacidiphilus sp. EB129]|uniref:hypothetical protein n=1 Tax=Streptacidiphilus sp. EB129 TaxID=3156262 RepID=UPI003510E991
MTVTALHLADPSEAADLGAFLTRLLRFDKAASVRLQTANRALAVFARLPLGDNGPLVIRTAPLADDLGLDRTVSAGQLLDAIDAVTVTLAAEVDPAGTDDAVGAAPEAAGASSTAPGGELVLPAAVTGPAWAGLLPPRSGWEHVTDLPTAPLGAAVRAAVTEFRRETDDADALAEAIWSRQVHPSGLTLRAVHAAHLVGLLQRTDSVALHRHPAWLRLSGPRGYVITRRAPAIGAGLGLTPTR